MTLRIDLNCDIGEGVDAEQMSKDVAILDYVTSANIACGFHAGDPTVMRRTVEAAIAKGVAIGAHPGLPDREGFGRRAMALNPREAYDITLYQIGALAAFAKALGGRVRHVKPHGALYNMAVTDRRLADALADAVRDFDRTLIFVGLANSEMIKAAERAGLRAAHEVFADRTYQNDGTLTPRTQADALIEDEAMAVAQVKKLVREGRVRSVQGADVALRADTVCLHGDHPHALEFARRLRGDLEREGVEIKALPETVAG